MIGYFISKVLVSQFSEFIPFFSERPQRNDLGWEIHDLGFGTEATPTEKMAQTS